MTELSYPWGGTATGDAALAPYSANEWSTIWSYIFNHQREDDGVLTTDRTPYDQLLRVFISAGVDIYVSEGKALVDGTLYLSDDVVYLGHPDYGSFSVVLRKEKTTQTVTAELRYYGLQQDDSVWEIRLADVLAVGPGTTTATDTRNFVNTFPKVYKRQGGSASDWGTTPGTTDYSAYNPVMQVGSSLVTLSDTGWDTTQVVTFPRAFNTVPVVIISGRYPWNPPATQMYHHEVVPSASDMTVTIKRAQNTDGAVEHMYNWIAIGQGLN